MQRLQRQDDPLGAGAEASQSSEAESPTAAAKPGFNPFDLLTDDEEAVSFSR